MPTNKQQVIRLRRILDRIVNAGHHDSDAFERELDAARAEIRQFSRDGILDCLDLAVGRSPKRQQASLDVLSEFSDVPGAADRVARALSNPDWRIRLLVLDSIRNRRLVALAPLLNKVILEDPETLCRSSAIHIAGVLQQEINFPVLLELANNEYPGLAWALKDYGREEGRPYLQRVFERPLDPPPSTEDVNDVSNVESLRAVDRWSRRKSEQLIAAWGLAKLGESEAIRYLGQTLVNQSSEVSSTLKLRAAQALADVFALPFEWHIKSLPSIERWWIANESRIV